MRFRAPPTWHSSVFSFCCMRPPNPCPSLLPPGLHFLSVWMLPCKRRQVGSYSNAQIFDTCSMIVFEELMGCGFMPEGGGMIPKPHRLFIKNFVPRALCFWEKYVFIKSFQKKVGNLGSKKILCSSKNKHRQKKSQVYFLHVHFMVPKKRMGFWIPNIANFVSFSERLLRIAPEQEQTHKEGRFCTFLKNRLPINEEIAHKG